jgi:tetratricopeptide (TPR) repeat protein
MGAAEPAQALLQQARHGRPEDFWVNHNLARALEAARPPRWDEAIRFHTAAVALRPQSAGAHHNLGEALHFKGRLDEAIDELQEAIRLKNDYAEAHGNLGTALAMKGRLDEAMDEFQEAIRLNKNLFEAH